MTPEHVSQDDAGIRVVVTPTQSSYFAGEPFSVRITITNTRSKTTAAPPVAGPSRTHKRAAHSISSAPLARPPTSPGLPRTVVRTTVYPVRQNESEVAQDSKRRGLVGKSQDGLSMRVLAEKKRKTQPRSLSVDVQVHDLPRSSVTVNVSPASPSESPSSSSPNLCRSPTINIPSHHPHARKLSILDGQFSSVQASVHSFPSSPSASNFSLSLDPISEATTPPYPGTPYAPSPKPPALPSGQPSVGIIASVSDPSSLMNRPKAHPNHLEIGHGHPSDRKSTAYRSAASTSLSHAVGTELILYAYAHLSGNVTISSGSDDSAESTSQSQAMKSLRSSLLKQAVLGGGSMDITAMNQRRRPTGERHYRTSSISSSIMSFISPLSTPSPPVPDGRRPTHGRAPSSSILPSFLSSSMNASGIGLGLGLGLGSGTEPDSTAPLPTLEVQPSMLGVDLALLPGESRTFTYTINLPHVLPPTFKGHVLRFSYELVVGVCRSSIGNHDQRVSKVMKVPVRVYNHVTVNRAPIPYDLLWPLARRRKPDADGGATIVEETKSYSGSAPNGKSVVAQRCPSKSKTFQSLGQYAQRLVASLPEVRTHLQVDQQSPPAMLSPALSELEMREEEQQEGALTGCRETVEVLTRNPKKMSYNINKDGVQVAVLTFTKSAYRLGETIMGTIEINERDSRARVLGITAKLETVETLPASLGSSTRPEGNFKRIQAEHHSSFASATLRTAFALDIPSDGSPAFQVDLPAFAPPSSSPASSTPDMGGLEWRVRLCLLVSVAKRPAVNDSNDDDDDQGLKYLVRDGPRGEWGTSFRASGTLAPSARSGSASNGVPTQSRSWISFFAGAVAAFQEDDEDEDGGVAGDDGVGGGEDGWRPLDVETVECEVPIKVWPGNTAYRAVDAVFDL